MLGIEAALECRIVRDPELKMVKGGTMAMLSMSLAVDEPVKPGEDAKTTWVNTKLFGDKAKAAADRLAKGDRVYCEGRLSLDSWTGQDGQERHGLSLIANVAHPLGKIGRRAPPKPTVNGKASASQVKRGADAQRPHAGRDDLDGEMPF